MAFSERGDGDERENRQDKDRSGEKNRNQANTRGIKGKCPVRSEADAEREIRKGEKDCRFVPMAL